jgi:uncharacterized membrane protein
MAKQRSTRNGPGKQSVAEPQVDLQSSLAKLAEDETPSKLSLGARLRTYLLTGLVVVGPLTITLYASWYVITLVDSWVKPYLPASYNPDNYLPISIPGFGLIFAVLGLMLTGALAANLIGRSVITTGEMMLGRMPVVRNVYRGTKQIFESVLAASSQPHTAQKVALMEFPSKGIWAIVFVTADAPDEIASIRPDDELISVFMPTHFLPPSGFVVFVPRASVIPVDITVEDAAKIIISAGMVNPTAQKRLAELAATTRAAKNGMQKRA